MKVEIACPKCSWEPDGGAYWQCECGFFWNTFETSAKCPSCSKVWEDTQCPGPWPPGGCGAWSKHIDWYKNLDDNIRREIEEVLKKKRVVAPTLAPLKSE